MVGDERLGGELVGPIAEAQRKLRELLVANDKGLLLEGSKATLGEFLCQWLDDYGTTNTGPRTEEGYRFIVRCHLVPALRNISLNRLQPSHLQLYYAESLAKGR